MNGESVEDMIREVVLAAPQRSTRKDWVDLTFAFEYWHDPVSTRLDTFNKRRIQFEFQGEVKTHPTYVQLKRDHDIYEEMLKSEKYLKFQQEHDNKSIGFTLFLRAK